MNRIFHFGLETRTCEFESGTSQLLTILGHYMQFYIYVKAHFVFRGKECFSGLLIYDLTDYMQL